MLYPNTSQYEKDGNKLVKLQYFVLDDAPLLGCRFKNSILKGSTIAKATEQKVTVRTMELGGVHDVNSRLRGSQTTLYRSICAEKFISKHMTKSGVENPFFLL